MGFSVESLAWTAAAVGRHQYAATLLGVPPAGDFQLSARVRVGFRSTFDAGVLLLWLDRAYWAKLCFEFSPQGDAIRNRGNLPAHVDVRGLGGYVIAPPSVMTATGARYRWLDRGDWRDDAAFAEAPAAQAA